MESSANKDLLKRDPITSAKIAGLHYVADEQSGFRRKRWGRGFTYIDSEGNCVQDPDLRERFAALVIPPAWTDVWICASPEGHIQATGRDSQGRKQYIYHPRWEDTRNLTKFNRMIPFGESLSLIRTQVDQDLRKRQLSRRKVIALVVRLLEETLIRIGNAEYASQNDSYGLTTLQDHHVDISGSKVHVTFRGKSGKHQELDFRDRRLARLVKQCQELPGQELFQYIDEAGESHPVASQDINDYLREATDENFTAKDFRTWGGTVLAATELFHYGPCETKKEGQRKVVQAIKTVAEALGNTPAVCRNYYIHPAIIDAYLDETLFEAVAETANHPSKDEMCNLTFEEIATLNTLRRIQQKQ